MFSCIVVQFSCLSQEVFIALFAFIPGELMFGALVDSSCTLWSTSGSCSSYNTSTLRWEWWQWNSLCVVLKPKHIVNYSFCVWPWEIIFRIGLFGGAAVVRLILISYLKNIYLNRKISIFVIYLLKIISEWSMNRASFNIFHVQFLGCSFWWSGLERSAGTTDLLIFSNTLIPVLHSVFVSLPVRVRQNYFKKI